MKLTAQELRIGNLVQIVKYWKDFYDENYFIPKEINLDDLRAINNFKDIAKPIPLTDEWLLKFGFEINDDLGDEIYYQIPEEKNGYGICFDHNDITFYKYYGNGAENVHTLIYDEKHLQSVHQLQNIYFSLTNTELKLINRKQ